jgi:hypothetical protein
VGFLSFPLQRAAAVLLANSVQNAAARQVIGSNIEHQTPLSCLVGFTAGEYSVVETPSPCERPVA